MHDLSAFVPAPIRLAARSGSLVGFAGLAVCLAVGAAGCARRVVPEHQANRPDAASPAPAANVSPQTPTEVSGQPAEPAAPKPPPLFSPVAEGKRFLIAWTGSVEGYVSPCGCTGDPLGGVARLSAALEQARGAYGNRVLFLDAGNLFFETGDAPLAGDACQTDARIDLLLSTYARQGLAATTWGRHDDVRGATWRDSRLAAAKIPTVFTAGEASGRAKDVFQPFVLREVAGVRIGVLAFRVGEAATDDDVDGIAKALSTTAKRLVEKEGAEVVVTLVQAKRPQAKAVLAKTSGVAVALLGEDPGELPATPERIGDVLLMSAARQAQYLGLAAFDVEGLVPGQKIALDDRPGKRERRLRLLKERVAQYTEQLSTMEDGPRKTFVSGRLEKAKAEAASSLGVSGPPPAGPHVSVRSVPLRRGFAEEAQAKRELEAYEAAIPTLTATCEANITCPPVPEGAATYVGVESCYQCHRGAVQFWQQQKVEAKGKDKAGKTITRTLSHASAWDTLVDEGKDTDRTCVGCHSIGFNQPGGYCKTSEVDFRTNVQCEACHGPASKHVAANGDPNLIALTVEESTCRGCHHVPHIETTESFVYDERLLLILGEGHGLKKRQEIEAKSKQP